MDHAIRGASGSKLNALISINVKVRRPVQAGLRVYATREKFALPSLGNANQGVYLVVPVALNSGPDIQKVNVGVPHDLLSRDHCLDLVKPLVKLYVLLVHLLLLLLSQ